MWFTNRARVFARLLSEVAFGLFAVALICIGSFAVADDAKPVDAKPVIVLTGFEPFGSERPPNPSWEGIRDLHGTDFKEFRIVALEMPVLWGEPLKRLGTEIRKHNPVAVFSFGQGLEGSFAIESRAVNLRGPVPDNAGSLPPESTITVDGPEEFRASFPCEKIKDILKKKGHPVRVSKQAGQYLCEETLYSLEYLRKQHPELTVAFCHVPPLKSRIGKTTVDKELIRTFVLDYLEAWHSLTKDSVASSSRIEPGTSESEETDPDIAQPKDARILLTSAAVISTKGNSTTATSASGTGTGSSAGSVPATKQTQQENPELPAVKKLIDGYFKSWSEQRMKDYGDCFAEGSVVQEITRTGAIFTQEKEPFVAGQAAYHKSAVHKAIEVPVKTDITFEAEMARAVVYWKLTAGPRLQYGYDHFTLMKQNGEWKIVNLVFYGVKAKE